VAAWCRRWCARWARPIPSCCAPRTLITETLKLEETRFRKTLERGLGLLDDATKVKLGEGDMLKGDVAFKLYDTYGFPLDLTQDALRAAASRSIPTLFTAAMEQQKAEGPRRLVRLRRGRDRNALVRAAEKLGATEFLGYDTETPKAWSQALMPTASRSRKR
jgi:alanyl-tRNA synthetase